jgi:hypothetical protein
MPTSADPTIRWNGWVPAARMAKSTSKGGLEVRLYPETAAAALAERWEWVSSGGKTQMIERDSNELELQALQSRFFPLVEFWRARHCLPDTSVEITQFASELEAKELYRTSLELGEPQWDVLETRSSAQIVDEFLDRIRQAPARTIARARAAASPRKRRR